MRHLRHLAAAACTTVLLVACGGGDPYEPGTAGPAGAPAGKASFSSVVSFGDSVSDLGTLTQVTVVPNSGGTLFFGGKFTTNVFSGTVNTSTTWVENVAAALGLQITPAEVGYAGVSVKCPYVLACTGYGQGGSRITSPDGVRHNNGAGALTVPVRTQISNHLARFGGFTANDLVLVQAGGNDLFMVMDPTVADSLPAKAARLQQDIAAAVAQGQLTAQEAETALKQGLFGLQVEAQATLKRAALELAGYVRSEILDKGAKYVVVMNLPDLGSSPEGRDYTDLYQRPDITALLTTLTDTFNLWLREGLAGQPVLWFDAAALFDNVIANPGAYQIVDARHRACSVPTIAQLTQGQVTDGFSPFCNATPGSPVYGLDGAADINTWFFADGNHPTVGGHRVISDEALRVMRAAGWL